MPHQLLGILHLFAILGDTHMDLLRILLNQVQSFRGTAISGTQLLPSEFGHLVHQLGIEEALIFGLGLVSLGHEGSHGLWIGNSFIHGEGAGAGKVES
jgi:hypothetical protein